jgi:hypothetical protein
MVTSGWSWVYTIDAPIIMDILVENGAFDVREHESEGGKARIDFKAANKKLALRLLDIAQGAKDALHAIHYDGK